MKLHCTIYCDVADRQERPWHVTTITTGYEIHSEYFKGDFPVSDSTIGPCGLGVSIETIVALSSCARDDVTDNALNNVEMLITLKAT